MLLSDLRQGLVLRQRAVCRAQAGVCGGMDALALQVIQQLMRWVVRVQLNLVNRRYGLRLWIVEQLLHVPDVEVGNTDILYAAAGGQLLHLVPGVEEVPVIVVLLQVIRAA